MYRNIEGQLQSWLFGRSRKPLILRGARQVGKSTVVRNFAAAQGLTLHEVNLEKHPQLKGVFESNNAETILQEVQLICRKGAIDDIKSLVFIDEIQSIPAAIAALRYLYEDRPGLGVICAGSLMEFALSKLQHSMPVGRVEYLFLGPMSFEEFLTSAGQDDLIPILKEYLPGRVFSATAHLRLLEWQRLFLLVGGMPEAVQRFLTTKDFSEVSRVHASIAVTYRDDFAKYAGGEDLARLQRVFDFVPGSLGRKIKYVNIDRDARAAEVRRAIEMLHKAQVINLAYHTDASGAPLKAGVRGSIYKPYFLDCGLAHYLNGNHVITLAQLSGREFINEGALAEQFIAQHLLYRGDRYSLPEIYYWLREGKRSNAEVDFVVNIGAVIVPIEVKAGEAGSLKSLHQFIATKGQQLAVRFDLNPPSLMDLQQNLTDQSGRISFKLLSLPAYLVEQLPRLLKVVLEEK